jgi:hypothetical protein
MKRRIAVLCSALVVLAVALPACGNSGGNADEAKRAAAIVPRDALAYLSLSIDPSDAQKSNVNDILAKFPKASRKTFDNYKDDLLTKAVKELGLDYTNDVKPWLGSELSIAVLSGTGKPNIVGFIKSNNDGQAKTALDKAAKSPEFKSAYRIISGYAVVVEKGQEPILDVIQRQAQSGKGLADEQKFKRVVDQLHDDRLAMAWADGHALLQLAKAAASQAAAGSARVNLSGIPDVGMAAADLHALSHAGVLEGLVETPGTTGGGQFTLTNGLPKATLGALSVWNLGGAFDEILGAVVGASPDAAGKVSQAETLLGLNIRNDVLSWMHGELVIPVGPATTATTPDFGLMVNPTDKVKAQTAVAKIVSLLETRLGIKLDQRPAPEGGGTMYVFPAPIRTGIQPAMALLPDRFIIASSPEYLTTLSKSSGGFDDSNAFKDTLGSSKDGTQVQLVLQVSAIRQFVEGILTGESKTKYEQDVKPWLDPLSGAAVRVRKDGKVTRFEVKATVG